MLTIKCSACRKKLFKYFKIGHGEVLRCHKERITKAYNIILQDGKLTCPCGKPIGIDKGTFYSMINGHFTYAGTKENKR